MIYYYETLLEDLKILIDRSPSIGIQLNQKKTEITVFESDSKRSDIVNALQKYTQK